MSDYKPHIVIDEQKNIILPDELKNHMVQFDHNVKTLTFDCPRYSDGRDLSTMRIYVNYFRKSGEKDADACQNIKVDSKDTNLIHFEWVPKRSATLEAGVLSFLICAEKEDTEGNQENAWHTKLCKDLKIAEGMDCLKAVIEKYPTIITYLLTRMEDVESIATPEAMQTYVNQYLLENPPSGMTEEERALLEENIALTQQIQTDLATVDQSKADAIICTSEGSTIVATDSAEAGFEGLHLYGRSEQVTTTGAQLLDMSEAVGGTDAGITVTVNDDGSYTMSGTATAETANVWLLGYYGSTTTLFRLPAGTYYLKDVRLYNGSTAIGPSTNGSFTLNSDTNITGARCVGGLTIGTTYNTTKYPMINSGTEALPWEPYTGGKPSPSVDYTQEIVSAGDSGSIEVGSIAPSCIVTSNSDAGYIVHDGTIGNAGGSVERVSGYVECTGGNTLYISIRYPQLPNSDIWVGVGFYDVSKNFISRIARNITEKSSVCDVSMSIPTDARYMMISFRSYGNGILAAYDTETSKQTITSLTPNGLPGIKVTDASLATYTDADGQMWCADEIDYERGVYVQRIGNVNKLADGYDIQLNEAGANGFNQYTVHTWYPSGRASISSNNHNGVNAFCNMLPLGAQISSDTQNECFWFYGTILVLVLNAEKYPDIDSVKDLLDNTEISLQYVLKTPIEIPLSDEEIAAYKALHSNYPTTTIMNSENVHMNVDYVADTKNHIKQNYVPLSKYTALEEHTELVALARENALPENSYASIQEQIDTLFKKVAEMEAEIAILKGTASDTTTEEYPEYTAPTGAHDAYYAGDKITYNGVKYICIAPEGVAVVWDPDAMPTYWQKVTEESNDQSTV